MNTNKRHESKASIWVYIVIILIMFLFIDDANGKDLVDIFVENVIMGSK